MEVLLQGFKDYLKFKGYSCIYENPVKLFLLYCVGHDIDFKNITFGELSTFILYLKERYSLGYINNFIKGIKFFYKFLEDTHVKLGELVKVDLSNVTLFPVENKIKYIIDLKKLDKIISRAISFRMSIYSPWKIKAILYFLYFTGIRRSELINLKRCDIFIEERKAIIRIPTKNRKEREVYFPFKVAVVLSKYFKSEGEYLNAFNTTKDSLFNFFRYLKTFDDKLTPHILRHSFTQLLASKGIDIRIAQELLGHKSLASTLIYYNPNRKTCKTQYLKKIR